ncbi:DUF1963 domain-containing protein [Streptomyces aidingensis]|uniref:DUF1963 domain-containing protein n=1 Tax=Streptomyces aidingensis TaxID=910347 RepID=A0A1I1ES97_9ACTN|nr:DUF1963 domain-containing protein [Streptomyces aidingensis]SFB87773.1 hypothetical protein SAMN05421773_101354 [Streptomyces aidingensis]
MVRHTPPRPVPIEELCPELAPFRREAVRLHPRSGSPTCRDSSVGGPLLWPEEEPWPICPGRQGDVSYAGHEEPVPYIPIAQVYRSDAPWTPFPEGRDLLQVLWCPYDHGEFCYPLPMVRWRSAAPVARVASAPPPPAGASEDYVPDPCILHPEPVVEYPSSDLPDEVADRIRDRLDRLETETGWMYHYHLADAPGIKLGGYPGWTQEPCWPGCPSCGKRMEHLITVSSWECDGESWRTWLPTEDRVIENGRETRRQGVINAAGLMLGDAGGVYIFECPRCPDRPLGHWFDCS